MKGGVKVVPITLDQVGTLRRLFVGLLSCIVVDNREGMSRLSLCGD